MCCYKMRSLFPHAVWEGLELYLSKYDNIINIGLKCRFTQTFPEAALQDQEIYFCHLETIDGIYCL